MESEQIGLHLVLEKMREHLAGLNAQIEIFTSGKVRAHTGGPGEAIVDDTEKVVARLRGNVTEIQGIIDEAQAMLGRSAG